MNWFTRTLWVQVQYCLLIVLMVFATLGCSAKQNLFGALDVVLEKPLTAGKTLSNTNYSSCQIARTSSELRHFKHKQKKNETPALEYSVAYNCAAGVYLEGLFQREYRLQMAGTSPPLYLLFKKIKLALVA